MKNIFLAIIAIALTATACGPEFLDREPEGSYVGGTFYVTPEALKAATAPLYTRAWFKYHERAIVGLGSLRANEAYNHYFMRDFTVFKVTSLHYELRDAWQGFYSVVTMANATSDAITKNAANVTEEQKNVAIAECRIMRAIAYFYMVRLWGSVIIIDDNLEAIKNPQQPRHREEDIFCFIIEDLEFAAKHLPESWDRGRATSWSAKAFLAKVYLARSGWNGAPRNEADLAKAMEHASDVINNSGLALLADYENLFKYKGDYLTGGNNNQESLLAMQWLPIDQWFVKNTLIADLAFSSDVTGGVMVWGGGGASADMIKLYMEEPADTLRRDATFFTQGAFYPYINIAGGGYLYTGTGAPVKKGVPGGPNDNNDGFVGMMFSPLNTYLIRLADTYLTYAEACLGNNQSLSSGPGLKAFNDIRNRAKIPRKASITFEDIIRERRVEFAMEYQTWYDMVSWYKWKPDYMFALFNNELRGHRIRTLKKDPVTRKLFLEPNNEGEVYEAPDYEVIITHESIFLPYPESDLIQNPLLKEPPQPYNFK